MPFIKLSNPMRCNECGKVIPRKRGAFWEAGVATCVPCAEKVWGVVPMTKEEEAYMQELEERIK